MSRPRYKSVHDQSPQPMADFVGHEIVRAVAALHARSLVGPWPATLRQRAWRGGGKFPRGFLPEDHAHPHAELCHLLGGQCAMSYRLKHYLFREGDLGFFPPGVMHAETFRDRQTAYRSAWWVLSPQQVIVHVTDYSRRGGFRMMDRVILDAPGQEAREAARRLLRFCTAEQPPPILPVKEALLCLVLALLRRVMAQSAADRSRARRDLIGDVERYVAGHSATRAVTIAEVARHVSLSPNYLTTLFRAETGVPLGSYVKRQRMARAKELLLSDTGSTVKEICFRLGFDDPYTFSRAFRAAEGVSPQQYRRAMAGP